MVRMPNYVITDLSFSNQILLFSIVFDDKQACESGSQSVKRRKIKGRQLNKESQFLDVLIFCN